MQRSIANKLFGNGLLLAILLHLLFLLSMAIHFSLPVKQIQKPHADYVPAYVYSGAVTPPQPMPTPQTVSHTHNTAGKLQSISESKDTDPWGYQKPVEESSRETLSNNQAQQAIKNAKSQEPLLLIGDDSAEADPLVKLIGRSLSAHFHYPRMEGSFGIRGRVIVELILHPEGYFSNIRIIQSSDNQDFDAAALYAANTAPKVIGANQFIKKPKYMIIGFLFD